MPDSMSFARLLDWVEGRLTSEEANSVAEQVAQADEATRANVAWLHAFRDTSAAVVLVAPPQELHTRLVQSFAEHARSRRQPGIVRRLVATLTFDSDRPMAMQGVRSAGTQESQRQLIYTTEVADIALNIQLRQNDQNLDLNGQIFPKGQVELSDFSVQLLRGSDKVGWGDADDLGEFMIDNIPPGIYAISLRTGQLDVLVARVAIRV